MGTLSELKEYIKDAYGTDALVLRSFYTAQPSDFNTLFCAQFDAYRIARGIFNKEHFDLYISWIRDNRTRYSSADAPL